MALIVKSGVGALRSIAMDTPTAALVAEALAREGASFYCEPLPDERSFFYVDEEHARRVCQLASLDYNAIRKVAA